MLLVSQVCPAARATAWIARVALRSSMPVNASLRLTGVPAAMLAARRRARRSPPLQGSSPASSAVTAASQSMLASMVPVSLLSGPTVTNRVVKSSRCSQQPHPMMNSAAASRV
jgi:hypothetical protein